MFRLLLLTWLFLLTSADLMMDLKIIKACNETSPISLGKYNFFFFEKLSFQLHCRNDEYGFDPSKIGGQQLKQLQVLSSLSLCKVRLDGRRWRFHDPRD